MADESNEFEQYKQRMEYFERDLNPKIARAKEAQMYALNGCNAFAQQGMKALFVLNGGALLLIPTAQKMFGDTPTLTSAELVNAAIAFTIGIIFTMIATMSAFYQQQFLAHQMHYEAEYFRFDALVDHFNMQDAIAHRDEAQADSERMERKSNMTQIAASVLCTLSLLCFGIGSFTLIVCAGS